MDKGQSLYYHAFCHTKVGYPLCVTMYDTSRRKIKQRYAQFESIALTSGLRLLLIQNRKQCETLTTTNSVVAVCLSDLAAEIDVDQVRTFRCYITLWHGSVHT